MEIYKSRFTKKGRERCNRRLRKKEAPAASCGWLFEKAFIKRRRVEYKGEVRRQRGGETW